MIVVDNQTLITLNKDLLDTIAKHLTEQTIELLIVDEAHIKEMNLSYRGINTATDVLSFPLLHENIEGLPLGSIVLCDTYIQKGATTFHHTEQEEATLLFLHGLLHLLGYDHEVDNGEMRAKEKELIEHFGLPQSLIVRNS
jgi:probable rRNA maturation factor